MPRPSSRRAHDSKYNDTYEIRGVGAVCQVLRVSPACTCFSQCPRALRFPVLVLVFFGRLVDSGGDQDDAKEVPILRR